MDFDVREVEFGAHREEIGALRAQVWIEAGFLQPSQCPAGLWLDHFDDTSTHWAVFSGGRIVASARLTVASDKRELPYGDLLSIGDGRAAAFLSRLVVASDVRRNGLARRLDEIRLAVCQERGANEAWGAFPPWRVEALQALGFETCLMLSPEEFAKIDGYAHTAVVMRKLLA